VENPEEIQRLQGCINDLIGVLALPAIWSGSPPLQIMTTVLDALVGMLQLEFAFARLSDTIDGVPMEMVRSAQSRHAMAATAAVGQSLDRWLTDALSPSPSVVPNPVGAGEVRVTSLALGFHGIIVAGSNRTDFPTSVEHLVLRVAANQAAVWLQEARHVIEQRRVAAELERQVGERTVELTLLNKALTAEVAQRKHAAEQLEQSERRFRRLAEAIPHHVWTYQPDGAPAFYNRQLVDYTGLGPEELGQGGWGAVHPDDVEHAEAMWREALATGTPFEIELRLRGRDGGYRRFLCRAVPARDDLGQLAEWFGTNTDIEEQERSEEFLHQAQGELAHVSRLTALGELTASIAHEVNQPLGAIVTNGHACVRLLARDEPRLDAVREAVECIIADGLRASEVIERSRALVKKATPEKAVLGINETVREVIALAASDLARHQVSLRTALGAGLPPVEGDRVQLQQVILNLVLNASAAMSEADGKPRDLLVSSYVSEGGEVTVAVRDSGRGFDPNEGNRLFDAFYTTKEGGLGLGLSISRTIVEDHGGTLWAESTPGEGATFRFTIKTAGERQS
jgi:PAS domain S-box-containing protein